VAGDPHATSDDLVVSLVLDDIPVALAQEDLTALAAGVDHVAVLGLDPDAALAAGDPHAVLDVLIVARVFADAVAGMDVAMTIVTVVVPTSEHATDVDADPLVPPVLLEGDPDLGGRRRGETDEEESDEAAGESGLLQHGRTPEASGATPWIVASSASRRREDGRGIAAGVPWRGIARE
jgi:hypothetical protein